MKKGIIRERYNREKAMEIPQDFKEQFKKRMNASEYKELIVALGESRTTGLRVNRLKVDIPHWLRIAPFKIRPVPWAADGFYLEEEERPGIHPFYHAGLFYIQEPSAMFPAGLLNAKPGDKVLDLCAAPGGKTVRLAADMENKGFLLSNDINPKRVKALVKNIELNGIINTVVTNETPERLASVYEGFFDKILLDVPCSGEGMFRKGNEARRGWSRYKAEELQGLQRKIFDSAYRMLAPGGTLVYSTCTFNPEENEKNISWFLKKYPDLYLKQIKKEYGIEPGRPEWSDGNPELLKTARLWPHRVKGEGHFAALMARQGGGVPEQTSYSCNEPIKSFSVFCDEYFHAPLQGRFELRGSELHMLPQSYPGNPGLKTVKTGLYVGSEAHGKFEPSQSLAMALRWGNMKRKESFSLQDADLMRYLKGETLTREREKGYIVLGVECFPLGWGKIGQNGLKNLYPKGWRKTR